MRHNGIPPITTEVLPFLPFGRRVIVSNRLLVALGDGRYETVREAQLVDYRRYPRVVPISNHSNERRREAATVFPERKT